MKKASTLPSYQQPLQCHVVLNLILLFEKGLFYVAWASFKLMVILLFLSSAEITGMYHHT
jgi:hypothetical protein